MFFFGGGVMTHLGSSSDLGPESQRCELYMNDEAIWSDGRVCRVKWGGSLESVMGENECWEVP